MTRQQKSIRLLSILARSLLLAEKDRREKHLGDRSSYLGVSDISRGSECLRAAVASKIGAFALKNRSDKENLDLLAGPEETKRILQRQLTLSRGHWVEAGIGHALSLMTLNIVHQLEITANYQSSGGKLVPIQGHLDFTLVWGSPRPSVRILELKSYGKGLRDTLYTSYDSQIKLQVGLVHRLWGIKCFTAKNKDGQAIIKGVTFPELCRQLFGLSLPDTPDQVDIEGWVISVAPDDAAPFGPYRPDMAALSWLLEIGAEIWNQVDQIRAGRMTLHDVVYHEGFHPLCDWCDFNADCPKYAGVEMPEYESDLAEYDRLKREASQAKARLQEHEKRIGLTYKRIAANASAPLGWVRSESYEFRETLHPGKSYIQQDVLSAELLALFQGNKDHVKNFLDKVRTTGKSYSKCHLRKINKPMLLPAGAEPGAKEPDTPISTITTS